MSQQRVVPMLAYEDASRAAEWIARAFGFRETARFTDERGVVTDVVLERDAAEVLVGHPTDAYRSPRRHAETCEDARRWQETPYIVDGLVVYVDDVDAHFTRARDAGARILTGLETNQIQRQYRVEDIEGHRWMFAQHLRE